MLLANVVWTNQAAHIHYSNIRIRETSCLAEKRGQGSSKDERAEVTDVHFIHEWTGHGLCGTLDSLDNGDKMHA